MTDTLSMPTTAFNGTDLLCAGPRLTVALAVKQALAANRAAQILVFDDANGRVVDLDLRGSDAEIEKRLLSPPPSPKGRYRPADQAPAMPEAAPKGRGRPKLGVVSREVTLLPRHWAWLATQRGGASATLRRLVDEARRHPSEAEQQRHAREAAYTFMQAIAGDFPHFEDATRALFAGKRANLEALVAAWPADVRAYLMRLAFAASETVEGTA